MKNKPIIFTILSILCLIEPVIKILYFKAITQFDFLIIMSNLKARNTFVEVFDFWLVFPLAGLLIMKLRKWTYFAFLGILAYINYNIFTYEKYTWPYNSDTPFMYNYVIAFMSIGLFIYFLSPSIREPFFDRRIRIWESMARYNTQINCKLHSNNLAFPSQILNISKTGAFLMDSKYLNVGDELLMEFTSFGETISVPVEVVNKHSSKGTVGYGVRFVFSSFTQSAKMARVISVLKRSQPENKEQKVAA